MYDASSVRRVIPVHLLHPLMTSGEKPKRLTYRGYCKPSYTGELDALLLQPAKEHMGALRFAASGLGRHRLQNPWGKSVGRSYHRQREAIAAIRYP